MHLVFFFQKNVESDEKRNFDNFDNLIDSDDAMTNELIFQGHLSVNLT